LLIVYLDLDLLSTIRILDKYNQICLTIIKVFYIKTHLNLFIMKKTKNTELKLPHIQQIKVKIDKPKVARRVDVSCGEGVSC